MLSLIGAALFLLISIITYNSYSHPQYGSPAGKVLAGLCAATSVGFAIVMPLVFITYLGNGNILVFVSVHSNLLNLYSFICFPGGHAKPDRSCPLPGDIHNHL